MNVRFLRVNGIRGREPIVQAIVDNLLVKWSPEIDGWDCQCLDPQDEDVCDHINAVADLLDPRVLGDSE